MRRKAHAKITLSLQAVKKGNGGIHFDNVIVPIDLFDMVYLEKNPEMLMMTDKEYLPVDKRNTAIKAIMEMKRAYNIEDNFTVRIVKNIPAQSGLGGGSADAAAIINMLDVMYDLKMSVDSKIAVARKIDEDTPFCLFEKPARVQGIGDEITHVALNCDLYYLLVKPHFGVSTRRFLKKFKDFDHDTSITDSMISACENGDYQRIMDNRHNALQNTVVHAHPTMRGLIKKLEKLNLEGVCMSGTGTSLVGFSQNIETVQAAYMRLALRYPFVKYGVIKAQDVVK